jgi:hypothetical protein
MRQALRHPLDLHTSAHRVQHARRFGFDGRDKLAARLVAPRGAPGQLKGTYERSSGKVTHAADARRFFRNFTSNSFSMALDSSGSLGLKKFLIEKPD